MAPGKRFARRLRMARLSDEEIEDFKGSMDFVKAGCIDRSA
jgi:hypothetical protein